MSNEFWDDKFGGDTYRYGKEPNAFLEHRHTLLPKRGKILVLGDGEGRNGVFLAKKKFDVTTIDASKVGIEKAKALADEVGVELDARYGVLPDVEIEEGAYDGVVITYLHLSPEARKATHNLATKALKSGGVLIMEAFDKDQLNYDSGGPPEEELLYDADMLRSDFDGLVIEGISQLNTVLHEGHGHEGEASVIRLIATKD
jgi:hypothetical protein